MSFTSIIGHQRPIFVLRRAIAAGRVPQAYLFSGPANVGKTMVAREFAMAANCLTVPAPETAEQADGCGECANCRRIARDIHPDIHMVRPLAKVKSDDEEGGEDVVLEGAMITTEQIGTIITEANLKATEARRKVFIISSAEKMNPTSANRLLKTLEEPPGQTTLILTTQNLSLLLPTIISRCQPLTFQSTPLHEAEAALRERYPETDQGVLRSVCALSGGRVGWAIRLLEHPEVLDQRAGLLALAASLPDRDWFEAMALGEKLLDAAGSWWLATEDRDFAEKALKAARDRVLRTTVNDILDILTMWFRDLALMSAGGDEKLVVNADQLPRLRQLARAYTPDKCRKACEDIETIRRQIRGNANLRLAAEVLALRMLRAGK